VSPQLCLPSGCGWRRLSQDMEDSCCILNTQLRKAVNGWSTSLRVGACAEVATPLIEKLAWYEMLYTNFKKRGRSMQWIHLG